MIYITPEQMELAYELLRASPPFKRWRLPSPDTIEFHAVPMRGQDQADCHWNGNRHVIRIASNRHHSLPPLIVTMAHEMVHLHLDISYPRDRAHHGRRFNQHADIVCRHHVFDRGQF